MSNTWDYRFAFRIQGRNDVPSEFQRTYDRLLEAYGPPVFGLFTPAMEDREIILSRWLPPKVIVLFQESLAILSLETRSDHVITFELCRQDFLGFGLAEFLLNCWFNLYPGNPPDDKLLIRFPSPSANHFQQLAGFLQTWCVGVETIREGGARRSRWTLGLPTKFSNFIENHPELQQASELFFQPAMKLRQEREGDWSNLLLLVGPKHIVALSDQYRGKSSQYGIEMTCLPLQRVSCINCVGSGNDHQAAIQTYLKGMKVQSRISWPVFSGLEPYALRWVEAVNSWRKVSVVDRTSQVLLDQRDQDNGEPNSLRFKYGNDVKAGRN